MRARTFILMIGMLIEPWIADTLVAQVEEVAIGVDGLACPFCSYGLEKKLKEATGVSEVTINIDKGIALLKSNGKESIDLEQLEPIIKDAGFTLRDLRATVVGRLRQINAVQVLLVNGNNTELILKNDAALQKLYTGQTAGNNGVRVTGRLTHEMPEGHHAHPFMLSIEEFHVL